MTPENGLRERVTYHGEQISRLWTEKASAELLARVVQDVAEMKTSLESIEDLIAARPAQRLAERQADEKTRKEEREAEAHERKVDRRWRIGTALLCVSLIIGAMAILLPALSGGG